MKTADRPPYFMDPPDHTSEYEEENALQGYIGCDVPRPGVEPLRTGDIIRFVKYPTNESTKFTKLSKLYHSRSQQKKGIDHWYSQIHILSNMTSQSNEL